MEQRPNIKTIHIIRHGETVDNVSETLQGQRPGKLNEKGIQQAIERGKQMKDYKIDVAWVSDLKRASDTFLNIHDQMVNKIPTIEYQEIVRERKFGNAEGWANSYYREQEKLHKEKHGEDAEYVAEGAESKDDLKKRVLRFIEQLKDWVQDRQTPQSLVVVTHGIFIRLLLKCLNEQVQGSEKMTGIEKYSNVELSTFDCQIIQENNERKLELLNWSKQLLPNQQEVRDSQQM